MGKMKDLYIDEMERLDDIRRAEEAARIEVDHHEANDGEVEME